MTYIHETCFIMSDPTNSREEAFATIVKLREKYGDRAKHIDDANEAKTRVILIDEILRAIGWTSADFNPETPAGRGFIDYLLTIDNVPHVVVEAKRVGHTFRSPASQMHENDYALSYFRRAYGRAIAGVLEQATTYAHEKEVPFAVLTNGAKWLLVQVIPPPGKDVEGLRGFYFGNLLSDNSNFNLFWELLSKPSVMQGALEEQLAQLNSTPVQESFTIRSEFGEFRWKRPKSNQFLRDFYHRFFAEITDSGRRKMLEKCFATDSRLDQYQGELKRALRDTAPGFLPEDTQDISPEEGEEFLLEETGDQAGRVILVTGSVGCGKSTLVTKVLVEAKRRRQDNLIVLKVDLIDEVAYDQRDISPTLWRYISEEWKKAEPDSYNLNNLRKYFARELAELKGGEFSDVFQIDGNAYTRHEAERLRELKQDSLAFFSQCWRYYKQKHYGIALIIDNVDRASEEYQEQVYAFANKLASRTGSTIIITMREFTFFRGRESGFLDVRSQDTILHLQTPNLEQLLSKRIRYIQEHMLEDYRVSQWKKSENWESFKDAAQEHANMLKQTFLTSDTGRDILSLLAAISWHDVRYFLDTLRRLHSQLGTSPDSWSVTDVVAALMTASDVDRSSAVLSNIYRPSYPNYQCYFLKIRVLLMLIYSLKSGELRRGVTLQKILAFTRLYGYQTRWAERAVEELVRERYLECLEAPSASDYTKNYRLSESHSFRASPLAVVLVQRIVDHPIYLCLIGNDLPFYKTKAFERYKETLSSVIETLDDYQLERDALDLITDTYLGKVVALYLSQSFDIEQPPIGFIKNLPEVSTAERQLQQIIEKLKIYGGSEEIPESGVSPIQQSLFSENLGGQSSLFDQRDTQAIANLLARIPIPENITEVRIDRSEQGALIFWALVFLLVSGRPLSSGVEITDVINKFLVDDHHQKFPNNISRALRSPVLQSQQWLITSAKSHSRYKQFGLVKDWQKYWERFFNEPAPQID